MRSRSGKKRQPPTPAGKTGDRRPAPSGPRPPQGGYFLWGRHAVLAALANPKRRIASLYASGDAVSELGHAITALPPARQSDLPPVTDSDRRRLDAIGGSTIEKIVHQGMVAAVWPLEAPALDDLLAAHPDHTDEKPLRLICLDQLSDPRNVGAIMRSALALGATAIITTHRHAPEESGALARAAAGALERLPMVRVVNLARAIEALQDAGIVVAGLAAEGQDNVDMLADEQRLAIVMGAEGSGLRHNTRRHCDRLVRIDISEDSESLNVSIAAAIALYASRRANS